MKINKKLKLIVAALMLVFSMLVAVSCIDNTETPVTITAVNMSVRPTLEVGFVGQAPSLEGGILEVTLSDGTTREVSMTSEYVTASPNSFPWPEKNATVTVRYSGHNVSFQVAEILEPIEGLTLTWSDEFMGDEVNLNNWEFQHGTGSQGPANPWGNRELQFYRGENATVRDGYLWINGRQQNVIFRWLGSGVSEEIYITDLGLDEIDFANTPALAGINREDVRLLRRVEPWLSGGMVGGIFMAEYTSARMRTHERFYQTFGRFEARMSIPAFPGSWNAFWMMPENNLFPTGGNWPRSGEIDIMENRGSNPRYVGQAVHFAMGNPGQHRMLFNTQNPQGRLPEGNTVEDFHTYRIDWRPESMIWYIDDVEVYRIENWRNPLGSDGGWTGWMAGAANTIEGVPTSGPLYPGGPAVGGLNTAYLLTRRASAPFDHNFHLILNMAIGGMFDMGNVWNIPEGLDRYLQVDWVRSWQFNDLIPEEIWIEEEHTQTSRTVGQSPNLVGGVLGVAFPDGSVMNVPTNDARIITYPRVLDTAGTNVPVELDFRGKRITVTIPMVLP